MQVREVICPSCSHRFMWMDVEEGPTIKKYRSVETGETFHTAVCPQCGKRVILLPDRIRAVLPGTEDNLEMIWEIMRIRAAMPSGCWTGWQNVRPFIRWRSIRPTRWGEPTWRGFWPDTGENSTGRKFCDNLTNG